MAKRTPEQIQHKLVILVSEYEQLKESIKDTKDRLDKVEKDVKEIKEKTPEENKE